MKVGEPTFFFLWWRSRTAEFPSWAEFLRTILCNAPNSPPPERAFSKCFEWQLQRRPEERPRRLDLEFSLMAQCNIRNKTRY